MTRYAHIVINSIFIFLSFSITIVAQQITPRFEHITSKNGLPENTVRIIIQDHQGYLWFGTQNGLVKYDGYEMKVYQHNDNDSTSLSNNQIFSIFEDKNHNVWVGTRDYIKKGGGLSKLNRLTDKFTNYLYDPEDTTSLNSNYIDCIYEDKSRNLWVGTDAGLNLFNQKENNFSRFCYKDKKYSDTVYAFIEKLKNSGRKLESILGVGNNARLQKSFSLIKRTPVLLVVTSEGICDFGWLEDDNGKIIFEPDVSESLVAGKNIINRIQIWCDTLNPGSYNLKYVSDWSYSYNEWGTGPDYPENWGIQLFNLDGLHFNVSELLKYYSLAPVGIRIFNIIEDQSTNCLLLGTSFPGIISFNTKTKVFEKHFAEHIGSVKSFYCSMDESIWIASDKGISKFIPQIDSITLLQPVNSKLHLKENSFRSIIEDRTGIIWAASFYEGLVSYNPQTNKFNHYLADSDDELSLSSNRLWTIFEDKSDILWIGTWTSGLDKFNKYKWVFNHYKKDENKINTLPNNTVSSIYTDDDVIWLGTDGTLVKYDINNKNYTNFSFKSKTKTYNPIYSIIKDNFDNLWFGTKNNGLVKYNLKTQKRKSYRHNPQQINSLSNDWIVSLLKDHKGKIWLGTPSGLNIFDPKIELFERFQFVEGDTCSLPQNEVRVVFEDGSLNIWAATNLGGFVKYDSNEKCFIKIKDFKYSVTCCTEDNEGNLWLGTHMSGIFCFNKEDKSLIHYTKEDGLVSNEIRAILKDDFGDIWVSTMDGLSKISVKKNSIKGFKEEDGLPILEFFVRSADKTNKGEIFFGGINDGFISFFSEKVKDNLVPPEVVISSISLFNQSDSGYTIKKYFAKIDTVEFYHHQNDLRFEFAAIHFNNPSKNKYKYKLDNLDKNWIDAGTQRNAVYTNLDPGEYVFRVSASNSDGIWNNNGASVRIIILPPWWATTWAYIIYTLIILSVIYFTWKLQLKRIRIKQNYEMSKFEAEKMHEVDELKSRFFANISHEFRTPLTLIFGPAKDILEKSDDREVKKNAGLIKRNASRLHNLVNQLLDLSKLESGKMKLEASEQDIIPLLKGIFLSFTSFAERKKVTLKFNKIEESLNVYIDKEKIEKIINNLLSNAFKFTPEGGEVNFTVEKKINDVEIRIADNGIGIPEARIDKIFDRFYQVDSSHTRQGEGTGIGLALTKELVELHRGKISVDSKEGEGTTFTIQLPLGKNHLKPEEIVEKKVDETISETEEPQELTIDRDNRKEKTDIDVLLDPDKPLLLVVEDNSDVRSYIMSHLEEDYRIQEAIDGEDGLNQAINHIPDLIISDVMMPKMDGFELCNKLKTDKRTSHIPIIMLTAKATSKDKIEGYETGADDYIMKPFDATELKVRIKNLIEIRRKLQEKFKSKDYLIPKEFSSMDEQFIRKVLKVINEHISDEHFSIESLSKESAMSEEQIYKKLKALTGKSPSLFLRSIRLIKAKDAIKEHKKTISEISFQFGFSSPAYFTKCFKEEFGYPPSDLRL